MPRALRLTQDDRDHLFRLAGHTPPAHATRSDHVSPALMRVLDRIDAPALVVTDLAETALQKHARAGAARRPDPVHRARALGVLPLVHRLRRTSAARSGRPRASRRR